eukprot:6213747-Pleurochrysis_carterae.AAC.2
MPHEVVDVAPRRIFDASGREASADFEMDICILVLTHAHEVLLVAELQLRVVCRAFPRPRVARVAEDYVLPSKDALASTPQHLALSCGHRAEDLVSRSDHYEYFDYCHAYDDAASRPQAQVCFYPEDDVQRGGDGHEGCKERGNGDEGKKPC